MDCTNCGGRLADDSAFCPTVGRQSGTAGWWSAARPPSRPSATADFWRRVGALLIDAVILGFSLTIVLSLANLNGSSNRLGQAIRVAVTDANGNRLPMARAAGRYLAKIISALILGIGYLVVAFTDRKRGLHDMIAGTLVQRV